MADDAGALLVRSGLVSTTALDDARARVASEGGTLGEQLVVVGAIADDALTDFYRSRLLVPQVNPNTLARLPVRVVAAIPADMAVELRAIPVALDSDNNLTVAMGDPSDRHAVDEIAFFTGAYVVRAVATQLQIAWCLAHYYGHVSSLGQRLLQGTPAPISTQPEAPSARMPRAKGLTGQVEALRHRAIAPVTGQINVARPHSGQIPLAPAAPVAPPDAIVTERPEAKTPAQGTDGVPDRPRPRSISGEIRVPPRRAESIRPPVPDAFEDDTGPEISIEVGHQDEDPTGPRKVPLRRRIQKSNPPELHARAGEVDIARSRERLVDEGPGIIVDQDLLSPPPEVTATQNIAVSEDRAGVVIHERLDPESAPILLERRRPSDPVVAAPEEDHDDEVVILEAKKPRAPRGDKRTRVGVGALPAVTRPHRDTEAGIPDLGEPGNETGETTDETTAAPPDDTSLDTPAAPPADDTDETRADPTDPTTRRAAVTRGRAHTLDDLAEPPPPAGRQRPAATLVSATAPTHDQELEDGEDDDRSPATKVMSAVELDEAIPERSGGLVPHLESPFPDAPFVDYDPVDDGWGPPGTTIPPQLLGAIPGGDDGAPRAGRIPMPDLDDAPLIVTPPAPPEARPEAVGKLSSSDSSARLIDLIRALEHAHGRDDVVDLMIDHLAESHARAGFFVIKPSATRGSHELRVFSIEPPPETMPTATLRLDQPSTLQDVVGTRLPYRGPMHDDASRAFLETVLGACPGEILLVPVAVRERIVGVLFGEQRLTHIYDDQLALASRAAGMALERILLAKRG